MERIDYILFSYKSSDLRSSIHFNSEIGSANSMEESGLKVKPLINLINNRLALLKISSQVCIDEMMIQSKSKFGPRIYQKGKPHPWDYKLYGLSDAYGIIYKLHLHCGASPQVQGYPDIGSTGNRVLSLIENVPKHQNFELYMDNFFTSIPLI